MSIAAIITLSITIAGFIGGVIAALVKLGAIVGRLMEARQAVRDEINALQAQLEQSSKGE